jgi:KDO2-lipid IV(A) lauroyltransferase
MLMTLLRIAARAPLALHHGFGAAVGWLGYLLSPIYAQRLRHNLAASGVCDDPAEFPRLVRRNIAETGKGLAELVVVWFRTVDEVRSLVTQVTGLDVVEEAERRGRGIIYVTPHLGCFDVAALYLASRAPMTVLYRPPRKTWLQGVMEAGRRRGGVTLAPTTLPGVKLLLKALKRGETVGMLPDQAPSAGEGAWVDFFGRPAYTMTLVGRLAETTGAPVILTYAERLPGGRGYHLDFHRLDLTQPGEQGIRQLNAGIENLIRRCPAQYLWAYNRYKAPAGTTCPGTGA